MALKCVARTDPSVLPVVRARSHVSLLTMVNWASWKAVPDDRLNTQMGSGVNLVSKSMVHRVTGTGKPICCASARTVVRILPGSFRRTSSGRRWGRARIG